MVPHVETMAAPNQNSSHADGSEALIWDARGLRPSSSGDHEQSSGAEDAGDASPSGAEHSGGAQAVKKKRIRVSQKGIITDLEREVQAKLAQLEVLRAENEGLQTRVGVLKRAVAGRNDQIEVLKVGQEPSASDGAAPGGAAAAAKSAPPHAAGRDRWWRSAAPVTADQIRATAPEDVAQLVRDYVDDASRALVACEQQEANWWADGGGGDGSGGGDLEMEGAVRVKEEPAAERPAAAAAPPAPRGRARRAAAADEQQQGAPPGASGAAGAGGGAAGRRAAMAAQFAAAQAVAGRGGDAAAAAAAAEAVALEEAGCIHSAAISTMPAPSDVTCPHARITAVVVRYVSAFKHLHLLKPEALIPLMGTNLETGARAAPPDAFWRGVVSKLALTPEQREDVRATHELYQSQLAGVMAERTKLQARLAEIAGPGAGACGAICGSRGPLSVAATAGMELSEALAANMRKEAATRGLLYSLVFDQLLTPLQMARMAVYSWPLIADAHAVVKVICEEPEPPKPQPPAPAPPPAGDD